MDAELLARALDTYYSCKCNKCNGIYHHVVDLCGADNHSILEEPLCKCDKCEDECSQCI